VVGAWPAVATKRRLTVLRDSAVRQVKRLAPLFFVWRPQLLAEIKNAPAMDVSMISVALRKLRHLA
jgi:hypothetical protein